MENTTESENQITTRSAGIRYGLFSGLVAILYFVILQTAGVDTTEGIGRWAGLLFTVALIYLAHKYYKENGDGYMSIGQGVGIGFWLGLISSLISSVFSYVYIKFIDQSFIQQLMDKQREAMEEKGNLSEDQIDQAMNMTAKFMTPEMIFVFGFIGGLIVTIIIAVIVSLITQKKNPEAFV
jgi:hypothetical protein